jgi:hypothetical protein
MNAICVYYDLNDPGHQYNTLINYLETFPGFAQAGSRVWFVNSNRDCASIRDDINILNMPSGDRIIIFKVGDTWSSTGLKPETANLFHENWMP